MAGKSTREQIVEAADLLFYQQGFEHTSFADIAGAVKISRGNFYYHFKSKDQILDAVIELRRLRTQAMLDQWEELGSTPQDRIQCFIKILITNQSKIMAYGCPVGTLSTELARLSHAAQPQANALFTLFHEWLSRQFAALGCAEDADVLAMHLLARSQGIATLAVAFRDENFVRREVEQMCGWLSSQITSAVRRS